MNPSRIESPVSQASISVLSDQCVGPSRIVKTSAVLPWSGFLLERQIADREMIILGKEIDQFLLAMVCSSVVKGQRRTMRGEKVAVRKTAGTITAIPPGPVPELQLLSEAEFVYCTFDRGFISRIVDQLDGRRPDLIGFQSGLRDRSISQLFSLLITEFEDRNPTGTMYAESLAEALALRFLYLGNTLPRELTAKKLKLPGNKLACVKELIEMSLDQDLTLDMLAKECGYSRAHFLRMFSGSTGMTPHRYVIQRRIAHAGRLLRSSEMTLADVALACGFSSQAHLTLSFRKQIGMTPAEFRRSR